MIRTAFVSSYPPRHCGIATYTQHLAAAVGGREVVAIHAADQPTPYPLEVHHRIRRDERDDYARTAHALRICADVVSVQHATGVWGGVDGESVLDFVNGLNVPAVVTLHDVGNSPTEGERRVVTELVRSVAATVVLSRSAATFLTQAYGAVPHRLEVIPHGIPDLPLVDAATIKPSVGLADRDVLLSFGLLGPAKGVELALAALPEIVAARPTTMFVILGATHPDIVERDGEAYRESLVALVARLGMARHVQFVDRFVGRVELTRYLEAADVILTPYSDPGKSAAATLAYAMAAGRAVVSTPFAHATELLEEGLGIVVPAAAPAELAAAVVGLLADPERRGAMAARAHAHSRLMTWWNVAARHRTVLGSVVAGPARGRQVAPRIALQA